MTDNSTTPRAGNAPSPYRNSDTIVFKYEGNIRACVTGHRLINGKVWVEAYAAFMSFLVPASQVVGVEAKEEE